MYASRKIGKICNIQTVIGLHQPHTCGEGGMVCCQAAEHCRIQRLQDVHRLGRQGQDDYIGSSLQLNYSQANVATAIVHYKLQCLVMSSMSQENSPEPQKKQLLVDGPFTAGAVQRARWPVCYK